LLLFLWWRIILAVWCVFAGEVMFYFVEHKAQE